MHKRKTRNILSCLKKKKKQKNVIKYIFNMKMCVCCLFEKVIGKIFSKKKRTTSEFHTGILIIRKFIYLRTILSKILVDYYVYNIWQKVSPLQESNPSANLLSGQLA